MKHPDGVTRVLEEIEMDLRKGNIDFKQADAARAAALAVSYRLAPKMDAALAVNAELRAALEAQDEYSRGAPAIVSNDAEYWRRVKTQEQRRATATRMREAALSRTDLGRGWASPEVVSKVRDAAIKCGDCVLCQGTAERHDDGCPVADLDALLGKAKP